MEQPPSDALLRSGTRVGEYRLLQRIGQGGMGTVYLATHPVRENWVAVKIMRAALAARRWAVSRFEREARLISQLRHPNVVSVFAFGELPDGRRYYVMEFLEGKTLRDHLDVNGRLSPEETVRVIAGVAAGLDAAHKRGIVHRDVKPANIFLTRDGGIKLFDFGVAKPTIGDWHEITDVDHMPGTPRFMSPEQSRGRSIDRRSDIYSLGLVAFVCLTGHAPFAGKTAGQVLVSQQLAVFPRLRDLCPELPESLEAPIRRALSKDRRARQRRASEFAGDLAAAAGLSIPGLSKQLDQSMVELSQSDPPTTRWTLSLAEIQARLSRRPLAVATIASVLLLGSMAIIYLAFGLPLRGAPAPRVRASSPEPRSTSGPSTADRGVGPARAAAAGPRSLPDAHALGVEPHRRSAAAKSAARPKRPRAHKATKTKVVRRR